MSAFSLVTIQGRGIESCVGSPAQREPASPLLALALSLINKFKKERKKERKVSEGSWAISGLEGRRFTGGGGQLPGGR